MSFYNLSNYKPIFPSNNLFYFLIWKINQSITFDNSHCLTIKHISPTSNLSTLGNCKHFQLPTSPTPIPISLNTKTVPETRYNHLWTPNEKVAVSDRTWLRCSSTQQEHPFICTQSRSRRHPPLEKLASALSTCSSASPFLSLSLSFLNTHRIWQHELIRLPRKNRGLFSIQRCVNTTFYLQFFSINLYY